MMNGERNMQGTGPVQRGTARTEQIQGLLDLAGQLQGILVPLQPDFGFREKLHQDLLSEAGRREPGKVVRLFQQYRKTILIGAAAVGSLASVAGVIIAIVLRQKHVHSTHMA
jgi:hypothetical protein